MLTVLAGLMVAAAVVLAALAAYVARRRGTPAGVSLAVLLLAVAWWGLTYALELSAGTDLPTRHLWGQLKYAGIAVVAPAWLAFVLQYTGRGHLLRRWVLAVLAVEPVAVMAVLLNPSTQHLVRAYPRDLSEGELPVVQVGWVFWVHLAYTNLLIILATAVFVATLVRVSRLYWGMSATLVVAALVPLVVNALHNFAVGPFARLDLTPFVFVLSGAVLVWGLFRERLVKLTPVARSVVIETMADGVVVLDAFGRVVDVNPAAARVLGTPAEDAVGRRLSDLLTAFPELAEQYLQSHRAEPGRVEVTLPVEGSPRHFDVRRQPLADRAGRTAGELFVLRDVTERREVEHRLREVLSERTRIASALQASLLPAALPPVEGLRMAARYHPAGDGREIGGDFYDVFPLAGGEWGVVLGDVSGKGAEAAAVTALIRYTLRTLATQARSPREVLRAVNAALLRQTADERYCTLVYLVVRACDGRGRRCVTVCLGGHPQPFLVRAGGAVQPVGALGTALGLIPDADLHEVDVDLGPGDLLCLFTDGLVEARRGKELFGEARVAGVLADHRGESPEDVAQALEQAARDFRGRQLSDDLAVLVLEVEEDPARTG